MPAPEIIHQLVQQFSDNRDAYRSGRYNEAQLRQEFLNPFFEALGWDVANRKGYSINYREVVHEDSIHIKGSPHAKAPDYAFRLGGVRKFFVEAKKPAEDIQFDRELAYQLKVYAWNVGLPISILTDFEEFAVYDCRNKPNPSDSPAAARILYLRYDQYLEKWDEIAGIFSPTAIQKGAFDRYVADTSSKKGTTHVDDAFLADIEEWRTLLARNIALRNQHVVNERQLNYAVQMTIDRIIFLRICEDRGIEPTNQLLELSKSRDIYPQIVQLFQRADLKYNSGLFHFKAEKGESNHADRLTPNLVIDDKVLKEIIKDLYYPCPYIFKEIPVEILGQVYEQFLGKVIRLTPGHQAKIEEKPEVRKAGGVYYTPSYIVDYIVANTVGKLVEGRTPEQVSQLKIVDPACGSGSFLLGAFQYLLDWHESWYLGNQPEKWAKGKQPALIPTEGGDWKLTTAEKKRILVNNIYGVDIDAQAVEVTKLSLLLKVLEEESGQLSLGLERVLPDLGDNIKCGNSLIGWDYFEGQLIPDEKELERVNPFDWQRNFPQVFARGGFDAVIGNPPYVRQETLGDEKKYFQSQYKVYAGTADLYSYFIEKGVNLLALGGWFSYVVSNKWMRANYGKAIRNWMKTKCIEEIVDFGDLSMFKNATTYPCVLRIQSNSKTNNFFSATNVKTLDFYKLEDYIAENSFMVNQEDLLESGWILRNKNDSALIDKILLIGKSLGDYLDNRIFIGIKTGFNKAFFIDESTRYQLIQENENSAEIIKPFLLGRDVKRYAPFSTQRFLIFSRRGIKIQNYPAIYKYLSQYKTNLTPKPKGMTGTWNGRKSGNYKWYELQDPIDYYPEFEKPKIVLPDISLRGNFTFDYDNYYCDMTCFIIGSEDKYLLGILNSKLITYTFEQISSSIRGGFLRFKKQYIKRLPIHKIDFSNPKEVVQHDRMVALVERMLELHKREPQTPQEADRIQREIAATDGAIDKLVYKLYGLTEEEVRIVETGS
ncbi:MAG: restriction endonuclease subunit R [Chloroflexi bacterium HGW-Chloroflexi-3]|nr:MAG: restriction endonuclease subunit R [Chloroflexi bacterium HGW-Chloroflexi-3]